MGVTIIDNTQTINNATWKVQPDVLASESGIVKENGTIHYIDGKLKYHADGFIKEVGVTTEASIIVLDVITSLPASPNVGDKYLFPSGTYNGVIEWNGSFWAYITAQPTAEVGTLVTNTKTSITYRWDGTTWAFYSSQTSVATPVIDVITSLPSSPTVGDRYLYPTGAYAGVIEWGGAFWAYVFQNTYAPIGAFVTSLKNNVTYRWNGTSWATYTQQKVIDLTLARKTDSYTLVATDNGQVIEMNKATANTLTVPSGVFTIGQQVLVTQYGAGQTTIAGSGVTLRSDGGKLKINSQYSSATILFISATEAYVFGNLAL
jgi:hypothetical protein